MIRTHVMSSEYGLNSHYEYNECIHNVRCNALPKKACLVMNCVLCCDFLVITQNYQLPDLLLIGISAESQVVHVTKISTVCYSHYRTGYKFDIGRLRAVLICECH